MLTSVATMTKGVEQPDTLVLPTNAYMYLAHTPRSDHSDMTILSWIKSNISRLKDIIEAPELNADSGITPYPGKGVGFLYKKDPRKFSIETPMAFYQHPVQPKGLEFQIACECRTAGAMIYYPLSMLIIPGV
jgi:hypothetical protein